MPPVHAIRQQRRISLRSTTLPLLPTTLRDRAGQKCPNRLPARHTEEVSGAQTFRRRINSPNREPLAQYWPYGERTTCEAPSPAIAGQTTPSPALPKSGPDWDRTSDLPRVKRTLSR